ncbi:MAG: toxin-antitoxin system HicB family antitoxin [Nitrospirales bacterium]|nr:toxin-antitoxin system HicB family antitoxin [Nitrospirales bacterium]
MSNMSLRLLDSLHEADKELARKDRISVNQLVNTALAEKISALMTEDYIEEHARRRNKKFSEHIMYNS